MAEAPRNAGPELLYTDGIGYVTVSPTEIGCGSRRFFLNHLASVTPQVQERPHHLRWIGLVAAGLGLFILAILLVQLASLLHDLNRFRSNPSGPRYIETRKELQSAPVKYVLPLMMIGFGAWAVWHDRQRHFLHAVQIVMSSGEAEWLPMPGGVEASRRFCRAVSEAAERAGLGAHVSVRPVDELHRN